MSLSPESKVHTIPTAQAPETQDHPSVQALPCRYTIVYKQLTARSQHPEPSSVLRSTWQVLRKHLLTADLTLTSRKIMTAEFTG